MLSQLHTGAQGVQLPGTVCSASIGRDIRDIDFFPFFQSQARGGISAGAESDDGHLRLHVLPR